MTFISVLIPAYNAEATIKRSIDSALFQESVEISILVSDNNSSDSTKHIVAAYSDPRVRLLSSDENIGYPRNVAKCINATTTPYFFILCADDYFPSSDCLQRLLDPHLNRNIIASHGSFVVPKRAVASLSLARPVTPLPEGLLQPSQVIEHFTRANSCFGWGWLVNKSLLDAHQIEFPVEQDMCPDTLFWLMISSVSWIYELPPAQPVYVFSVLEESLGVSLFEQSAIGVFHNLLECETAYLTFLDSRFRMLSRAYRPQLYHYSLAEFSGLLVRYMLAGSCSKRLAIRLFTSAMIILAQCLEPHRVATICFNFRIFRNMVFIATPFSIMLYRLRAIR